VSVCVCVCVRARARARANVFVCTCVCMACVFNVCSCVCMVCVSLCVHGFSFRASPSRSADQNSNVLSDEESRCKSSKELYILTFV